MKYSVRCFTPFNMTWDFFVISVRCFIPFNMTWLGRVSR